MRGYKLAGVIMAGLILFPHRSRQKTSLPWKRKELSSKKKTVSSFRRKTLLSMSSRRISQRKKRILA